MTLVVCEVLMKQLGSFLSWTQEGSVEQETSWLGVALSGAPEKEEWVGKSVWKELSS